MPRENRPQPATAAAARGCANVLALGALPSRSYGGCAPVYAARISSAPPWWALRPTLSHHPALLCVRSACALPVHFKVHAVKRWRVILNMAQSTPHPTISHCGLLAVLTLTPVAESSQAHIDRACVLYRISIAPHANGRSISLERRGKCSV